jgi:hypothetical protein
VLRPIDGNPQCIAWSARSRDLAAPEDVNAKALADKPCGSVVGKASENLFAGSRHDSIWQTV